MKKFEKTIGSLTKSQLEVFRGLQHCLHAGRTAIDVIAKCYDNKECSFETAKAFMREIIRELETRKKLEYQMWEKIKDDFRLSNEEFLRLEINEDTGVISVLTKEYFDASNNGSIDIKRFNAMWAN